MATETNPAPPPEAAADIGARREARDLGPLLDRVRPFTMVPRDSLVDLARLVRAVLREGIPGDFVESWKWVQQLYLAAEEILALVGPADALILVDQGQLDGWVAPRRRAYSFPEKDGEYWGPPEDDATAVAELERLRGAEARFIAFAWPAFWWLDYYAGFHRHLRSGYRCVLANDRLVVFDLRT